MFFSESFTQTNETIKVPSELLKSGKRGLDQTKIYFPDSLTSNTVKKTFEPEDYRLSQSVNKKRSYPIINREPFFIDNTNSSSHQTKVRDASSEEFEAEITVYHDSLSFQSKLESQLFEDSTKVNATNASSKFSTVQPLGGQNLRYILSPLTILSEKRKCPNTKPYVTFQDVQDEGLQTKFIKEACLFPNLIDASRKERSFKFNSTADQSRAIVAEIANCSHIPVVNEELGCKKTMNVRPTTSCEDLGFSIISSLKVKEKNLTTVEQDVHAPTNGSIDSFSSSFSSAHHNAWRGPSYTELATKAILSSPDKRMTLAELYDWMSEHVLYFNERKHYASSQGWKVRPMCF